jgi:hypothetical protein
MGESNHSKFQALPDREESQDPTYASSATIGVEAIQLSFPWGDPRVIRATSPNQFSYPPTDVEGGAFDYAACPEIFLGRIGVGPLRLAWDTNILSDYADFGALIWADEEFEPPVTEDKYRAEVLALYALMQLWMMRDIRIRVPQRQVDDARRQLETERRRVRIHQIEQLRSALVCVGLDADIDHALGHLPPFPVTSGNDEWDRSLMSEALLTGCHVFLTRDRVVLHRAPEMAASWLAVMSPTQLMAALRRANETSITAVGQYLMPDSHKWGHVMSAIKEEPDAFGNQELALATRPCWAPTQGSSKGAGSGPSGPRWTQQRW